jgi:hypothetical protein
LIFSGNSAKMVSIAASLSRDRRPATIRDHIKHKIMHIIAFGDIHVAAHEVATIAGLAGGGRLTVIISNSAFSIYL